ncbi:tetratricopeptide repeat protein [Pseudomonas sp. Fl5BN2]|uniref:tetratricopeptide repeat protein n=1 Tax=unclassified Pseudomonas TaxID=196821 RepID=UPI00137893DD|nr:MULTISPECIES: tetratricopeptide repeat protein [unclassified Pseudomonas]NBF01688.1 tetratricopeptide repeat protein [Pseudomonas sp. Fl5BN2]NBF07200.1 tetratricopeptide repeat protein [Pseudomonas sp. Fl4BN1]
MAVLRLVAGLWLGLVASAAQAQSLSIVVLDAVVKGGVLADAEVLVQQGTLKSSGRTDAQGRLSLATDVVEAPTSELLIRKLGYADLRVKCPCLGLNYALSPVLANPDSRRVVLSWSAPGEDLDAYLAYPHKLLFFATGKGPGTRLDVESSDSHGPETVTIDEPLPGDNYVFAVHDFTNGNNPDSLRLGRSQARVDVYRGPTLMRSYQVPQNRQGNLWAVFRLTADGRLQDIDRVLQSNLEPGSVMNDLDVLLDPAKSIDQVVAKDSGPVDAKSLNQQGEERYRKGDFGGSTIYYRYAIEMDPNYAQAYSNLALALRKNSRPDEAIVADRQAIALASGPAASTVRASAYYDMGRIYEDAGLLPTALEHYQKAREQKANEVYDKAIERLQTR